MIIDLIQPLVKQTIAVASTEAPVMMDIGAWSLTVEGTIIHTNQDQREHRWDGDEPTAITALAEALHGRQITAVGIEASCLYLVLNSGTIRLIPDDRYESWSLTGPDHLLIVCRAGGDLALWPAKGLETPG